MKTRLLEIKVMFLMSDPGGGELPAFFADDKNVEGVIHEFCHSPEYAMAAAAMCMAFRSFSARRSEETAREAANPGAHSGEKH